MSTTYFIKENKVKFDQLSKTLKKNSGLTAINSRKHGLLVSDGENYLHFAINDEGTLITAARYGQNNVDHIISEIEYEFNCIFIPEYDIDEYCMDNNQDKCVVLFWNEQQKNRGVKTAKEMNLEEIPVQLKSNEFGANDLDELIFSVVEPETCMCKNYWIPKEVKLVKDEDFEDVMEDYNIRLMEG